MTIEPLQGFHNLFPSGGALGINLMLELWKFVLRGFWNHIMGNQYYDPRTPSFWSLSVIKKNQKVHPDTTRNSQAHFFFPSSSFGSMLQQLPNDQPYIFLTSVQQRGMGDMIYYDFRSFCYQQLPNDQPNILFDICSAERDG